MSDPGGIALRRQVYLLVGTLALATQVGRVLTGPGLLGANDTSRWLTVRALVDQGTFAVGRRTLDGNGEYNDQGIFRTWDTVDLVLHPATREFFSSKPPLVATAVAPGYWLLYQAFGWTLGHDPAKVVRTLVVALNGTSLILYLLLLVRLVERHGRTDWGKIFTVVAGASATLLSPFLLTLNNHTLGALFALASLVLAWPLAEEPHAPRWRFALAGLSTWALAAVELPGTAWAVVVTATLLLRAPKRTLGWFLPAAALPVAAFLGTNRAAIGQWIPAQAEFGTAWYLFAGSYWTHPRELDALHPTKLTYAANFLIGHHGLFSLCPVLLLGLASAVRRLYRGASAERLQAALLCAVTGVVVGFYVARTNNYGGKSCGPRWLLWLVPLWLALGIEVTDRLGASRRGRFLCAALLAISVYSVQPAGGNPWTNPWIYELVGD